MHIHDKFLGLLVVEDLRTFEHPAWPDSEWRIGFDYFVSKLPVDQVLRCVTTDVSLATDVLLRAVLAKPVVGVAEFENVAAVRLNVLAVIVRPNLAGADHRGARLLHQSATQEENHNKISRHCLTTVTNAGPT